MVKVSQSKIKTWRKCKQAFHYRYKENLRKRRTSRPLRFGSIAHQMLEAYANGEDPFIVLGTIQATQRKLFAAEIDEYGDIVSDIRTIMTEYFSYYDPKDLVYIRKKGKSAEFEFSIEIAPSTILTGKIDGVAQTRNKLRWLTEHKTFGKSVPNEDHRWKNLQSSFYLRVLEMLGWKDLAGTCWDYIFSKSPPKPELLKNGTLSRRATTTLPTRVMEAIRDYKLNPKDYKDLLTAAEESRDKYFMRIFNPVKKSVVDLQFKDMLISAREIADDKLKPVRTIEQHCEYCDYEPLCRAELTDSDVDFVKEREYYVEEEKEPDRAE